MADWPPSLKPIGKYIVRAREVQSTQPLVAYYCNYYALKRAIELRDSSDEKANRLVTGLLEKCEAAKAAIGTDDGSHRGMVEEFALSVFDRADTEDREDRATKETAQTFYAAVCFFEVCSVFAPLTSDLDQRLRYAKWKAVDISKALKEGRRPLPGAPGEAEALEEQRRAAEAEQAAAEEPTASAPPADADNGSDLRHDQGAAYPQSSQQVPPAPPLREYDTDLHEYQPQPLSKDRSESAGPFPTVAPPYPSADISPLPQQGQYASNAKNPSAYTSANAAYQTTDGPYGTSNPAYPTTSGYPAPSAPYMPPSVPYATEDASQTEQPKGPVMPPIPSLDLPGIGTNMGDPPAGQQHYPPRSDPVQAPPKSDTIHAPPRSDPVYAQQRPDPSYAQPRPDPSYAQPRPDPSYAQPRPDPTYAQPRSDPVYAQPRSDPVHAPPQPDSLYAPPRSDPVHVPPRSEPTYPPQSEAFAARLAGAMPPQAPVRVARPTPAPATTGGGVSTFKPSIKDTQEAQRLAKYAASALDFQDLKTAVANLEDALNLLKGTR